MRRRPAALALLALLAGGCTGFDVDEFLWGPAAQRATVTRTGSDLTLCRYLRNYQDAPIDLRRDWAQELARRGQNCSNDVDVLSAEDAPGGSSGTTAFYKADRVSGVNRICRYDQRGSAVVITIPASQFCPLTLP